MASFIAFLRVSVSSPALAPTASANSWPLSPLTTSMMEPSFTPKVPRPTSTGPMATRDLQMSQASLLGTATPSATWEYSLSSTVPSQSGERRMTFSVSICLSLASSTTALLSQGLSTAAILIGSPPGSVRRTRSWGPNCAIALAKGTAASRSPGEVVNMLTIPERPGPSAGTSTASTAPFSRAARSSLRIAPSRSSPFSSSQLNAVAMLDTP